MNVADEHNEADQSCGGEAPLRLAVLGPGRVGAELRSSLAPHARVVVVGTADELIARHEAFDLLLFCGGGAKLVERVGFIAQHVAVPLVVVGDQDRLAAAREVLAAGALDYIGPSDDLARSLHIALARRQGQKQFGLSAKQTHNKLRQALSQARRELIQLRSTAMVDALTGLYNKRYFDMRLTQEAQISVRDTRSLTLMMVDVDHFKAVNDTRGHTAGDAVLYKLAARIQRSLRSYDVPCRVGGEEFAVILPGTPLSGALRVAERARSSMEQEPFCVAGTQIPVTVSIGVGCLSDADVGQLRERTDQALYCAKREGRNCVRVAEVLGESPSERPWPLFRVDLVAERLRSLCLHFERHRQRGCSLVQALGLLELKPQEARCVLPLSSLIHRAKRLGGALGLSPQQRRRLERVVLLQDVAMPLLSSVVVHNGALSQEDESLVRRHAQWSCDVARSAGFDDEEQCAIRHHHERFDGSGYPDGLAGEAIPELVRVALVLTAFVAMTTPRPYRDARPPAEALAELDRLAGAWYDPVVVEAAMRSFVSDEVAVV